MDYVAAVKTQYPDLTDYEAKLFVDKAKSELIDHVYPMDLSVNYLNFDWDSNPRYDMWILECVDELIGRIGMQNVLSYRENGISITFDRAGISQSLLDRLPSIGMAIKGTR